MTVYTVDLSPGAIKDLRRMKDRVLHDRLIAAIQKLSQTPRPPGCLKLVGEVDQWRVRVGDWRIVYRIEDGRLVVLVVTVAPRGRDAPGKRSSGPFSASSAR